MNWAPPDPGPPPNELVPTARLPPPPPPPPPAMANAYIALAPFGTVYIPLVSNSRMSRILGLSLLGNPKNPKFMGHPMGMITQ